VVHQGRGVASLHGHPRFRAAYDFLLLRAQVGEPQAVEDAAWWLAFVESGADTAQAFGAGEKGRSKRRRSSRRRKGADAVAVEGEADASLDEAASELDDAEHDVSFDSEQDESGLDDEFSAGDDAEIPVEMLDEHVPAPAPAQDDAAPDSSVAAVLQEDIEPISSSDEEPVIDAPVLSQPDVAQVELTEPEAVATVADEVNIDAPSHAAVQDVLPESAPNEAVCPPTTT